MTVNDRQTLEMALKGYQYEINRMQEKYREISFQLQGQATPAAPVLIRTASQATVTRKTRKKWSAEARANMAKAQKARWAKIRRAS